MSQDDWESLQANIRQMEQTLEGLKRLRGLAFPDSVNRALDETIAKSEQQLAALKNAIVN
jgi:hypothetical protein